MKIYLASTLVNATRKKLDSGKLKRNEGIARSLKRHGVDVELPQNNKGTIESIHRKNLEAIDASEGLIAVVSDESKSMFVEVGYAIAKGKKCYALNIKNSVKRNPHSTWHLNFEKVFTSVEEMEKFFGEMN